MDILLISPPVANFGQATSGLSVLTAYLRSQGWDAQQWDLAIDSFHHFHSPGFLEGCRQLIAQGSNDPELRSTADRVVAEIDSAKDALRTAGIESDHEKMRWAFETINDAGTMTPASS